MEKKRSIHEKINKMKDLGIFEKWEYNTDARTDEMYRRQGFPKDYVKDQQRNRRIKFLNSYAYLSDMIESSFIFSLTPEGWAYWDNLVTALREEI